jgi:hypothetical protein
MYNKNLMVKLKKECNLASIFGGRDLNITPCYTLFASFSPRKALWKGAVKEGNHNRENKFFKFNFNIKCYAYFL